MAVRPVAPRGIRGVARRMGMIVTESPTGGGGEMGIAPKVLVFTVSRAMGPTYAVELKDGRLRFGSGFGYPFSSGEASVGDDADAVSGSAPYGELDSGEAAPTREQWVEFRERLEAIDVINWREVYENPAVLDGWIWSFEVVYPDLSIRSRGTNSFPDSEGAPTHSMHQGFRSLARALRALSGYSAIEEGAFGGES